MTVYPIERVRAAVARALLLDPEAGMEAAIQATAQALALPVECVREAVETAPA